MSNKNPYEIRLEIMKMAKDYLDEQYQANFHFYNRLFEKALEANSIAMDADAWKQYLPSKFTPADLIKKSEEFYSFICGNKKSEEESVKSDKK